MNRSRQVYWKIFISMFSLSTFTFGGGYVIISLMQTKFVEELKWLEEEEMLNLAAIAQSAPGPVAVNASILIGYRVAGVLGALVSILGTIMPPLIIISIISFFYDAFRNNEIVALILKGMQAGIAAVIFDVVMNLGGNILKTKNIVSILLMVGAFIFTWFLDINIIFVIIFCAFVGIISAWLGVRKELG